MTVRPGDHLAFPLPRGKKPKEGGWGNLRSWFPQDGASAVFGVRSGVVVVVAWRRPGGSLGRCTRGCGSDG